MKPVFTIFALLILIILLLWLGLQMLPEPFPSYSAPTNHLRTLPLPENLPAPVERFYRQLYGDSVPVIDSAVISGTGRLRINGITLPARFRFVHISGQDYRHYIENTIFGLPLLQVNEHFLNGTARLELPFGVSEGLHVDQGANLALWAEAIWMPSIWITDPRVSWEALDENSATLIIPFKDESGQSTAEVEHITVFFDPETGLLQSMQSMRYKGTDSPSKTLWINEVLEWQTLNDSLQPVLSAVTWQDEGTPWARFTTLEVVYNADVNLYVQNSGIE
ncbi:MAG: hypothetical protein IH585_15980 [Anaerolineaceae bacterium]|nr:hypothetical protein [Anaerolineaceae bacterium]